MIIYNANINTIYKTCTNSLKIRFRKRLVASVEWKCFSFLFYI